MPKERSNRSASFEARSRASPYPCSSSRRHRGRSPSTKYTPESPNRHQSPAAAAKDIKEWDEILCPVCMEHPHNAVLLICSSSNKGCQPFMCDTSRRHSNCLDQYRKTFSESSSSQANDADKPPSKLSCPLCRGEVIGSTVVEPARRYMNSKLRSCSSESCAFTGAYGDLRKHARTEHPSVRPSEADPERQRDWIRMEQERDIGDLVSTMQSAMGGEDGRLGPFVEGDDPINDAYHSITVYFILRFRGPGVVTGQTSGRSARVPSRRRRSPRIVWGETVNNNHDSVGRIVYSSSSEDDDEADGIAAGGLVTGQTSGRSARVPSRRRRRSPRIVWGESVNNHDSLGRIVNHDSVGRIVYSSSSDDDDEADGIAGGGVVTGQTSGGRSSVGSLVASQTSGARVPTRRRRGRPTILWGESINNNPDASGRIFYESTSGDDDDDGHDSEDDFVDGEGLDELPAAFRQSRGRLRRQVMLSDEEDADEDLRQT